LLGITVIGAVLATRQSASIRAGHAPVDAFLSGYRGGLVVAALLVAAGGVAAYVGLRNTTQRTELSVDAPAAELEAVLAG
jgi:hypothetical protein